MIISELTGCIEDINIDYMIHLARELDTRLKNLGMTQRQLAARAQVGLATVQRVLRGRSATLDSISKVARALGLEVDVRVREEINDLRLRQARQKARRLVGLVQGSAGLEGQAVDERALHEMVERTARELLEGRARVLWDAL